MKSFTPRSLSLPTFTLLREGAPVLPHLSRFSRAADQYRSLVIQLEERHRGADGRGYVVAVTSCEESAGKTLTSLNLALTLASTWDRKVLLVEGDLWRPAMTEYLELDSARPGVIQVLRSETTLRDAVIPVRERGPGAENTGVEVLPAGPSSVSDDLIAGSRAEPFLEEIRQHYRTIVIDCPPGDVASGRSLVSRADSVVVVVRAGRTRRSRIEATLTALGPHKHLGFLLNAVKEADAVGYYS